MILFTQSTAVLHKYLNDELKILHLLHFFPRLHRISWEFWVFHVQRNPWVFQVCDHPVDYFGSKSLKYLKPLIHCTKSD